MKRSKYIPRRFILTGLLLAAGFLAVWHSHQTPTPIPVKPDISETKIDETRRPKAPVIKSMLKDNYVFRQDDDRWSSHHIGDTEDTLHVYGCTIAGVAMAVSNLTDEEITPGDLNKKLSDLNGFTDRGWLIWNKLPGATDNKVSAVLYSQPDHGNIQSCMDSGSYPVIKIHVNGSYVHWVLIVGTTEDDYLVRDPLHGGPDDPPVLLSSRADKIHSVRCIEKTP